MIPQNIPSTKQPIVTKYTHTARTGIRGEHFLRFSVGYVVSGVKDVYYGDSCYEICSGDIFFLPPGHHYIEDIPDEDKPFEQIVFFFNPSQLSHILSMLNFTSVMDMDSQHTGARHNDTSHASCPAWPAARNFFSAVNRYFGDEFFRDEMAESIKLTELIYLVISHGDNPVRPKIISSIDYHRESLEQVVRDNIFSSLSIDELASKCKRSATSFKKDFHRIFNDSPHRWFTRQRLMHSRLLLSSTELPVSEIGGRCGFQNTSHFIKLFKKEYGVTPAQYRSTVLRS